MYHKMGQKLIVAIFLWSSSMNMGERVAFPFGIEHKDSQKKKALLQLVSRHQWYEQPLNIVNDTYT